MEPWQVKLDELFKPFLEIAKKEMPKDWTPNHWKIPESTWTKILDKVGANESAKFGARPLGIPVVITATGTCSLQGITIQFTDREINIP